MAYMFQSLAPGSYIEAPVIDCWSGILNYEEKFKDQYSPRRVFLSTCIFVSRKIYFLI